MLELPFSILGRRGRFGTLRMLNATSDSITQHEFYYLFRRGRTRRPVAPAPAGTPAINLHLHQPVAIKEPFFFTPLFFVISSGFSLLKISQLRQTPHLSLVNVSVMLSCCSPARLVWNWNWKPSAQRLSLRSRTYFQAHVSNLRRLDNGGET